MKNSGVWTTGIVGILLACTSWALAEIPYYSQPIWSQQIGTEGYDVGQGVAVDTSGNVYICGHTSAPYVNPDIFLYKYNNQGVLQWSQRVGTTEREQCYSVAADTLGNVFITGSTRGSFGGTNQNPGTEDAFLCKYDTQGNLLWSRQIGTASVDESYSVAVDASGNAYICGTTWGTLYGTNPGGYGYDVFLAKYNSQGDLLWIRQTGTAAWDIGCSVAVDTSGNIYFTGYTTGNFPNETNPNPGTADAFICKYDSQGNQIWSQQIGTNGTDISRSVAVDTSGNIYITGYTTDSFPNETNLNPGTEDTFVCKYDNQGNQIWLQQFGTSGVDYSFSITVDTSGNSYICGYTSSNLAGTYIGSWDILLIKFDNQGNLPPLWSKQIGSTFPNNNTPDCALSIAVDASNNIYFGGYTVGSLFGTNVGWSSGVGCNQDAVLAKFSQALPGDANLDGTVDVGDLGILSANYGTTSGATWSMGDFNGDGAVDVGDLGILSAYYGQSI